MRVLVTNDDGIDAPGLHALVRAAADAGHEVIVAAPARQASGSSAAVLIDPVPGTDAVPERIRVEQRSVPGAAEAWSVGGSPAICVRLALGGSFGSEPELVLAGVNPGANTGRVLLHSGTVGAALTAGVMGVRAIAVSLDELDDDAPHHFDPAARLALSLVDTVLAEPVGTVLNLNVPNTPRPHPLVEAPLDSAGVVHTTTPDADADELSVAIALDAERRPDAGSDVDLLLSGSATVTAVVPPHARALRTPLP